MVRNYEVHIDGKPFIIGERPEFQDLPGNWLAIRVDAAEEFVLLKVLLAGADGIFGIHTYGEDVEQLWAWFRQGYRFVQAAGGAVSDGNGRLLAIHRLGRWDLPKGKVELGEALEAAAMREVEEECGLSGLEIIRPLDSTFHIYRSPYLTFPKNLVLKETQWFLMHYSGSEMPVPQMEEDIVEVRWVTTSELVEVMSHTYRSLSEFLAKYLNEKDELGRMI